MFITSLILIGIGFYLSNDKKEVGVSETIDDPLNKYDNLFKKYGEENKIPWQVLKRMAYVESTLGLNKRVAVGLKNPKDIEGSKSEDGLSWGLMQMTVRTARDYDANATAEKLNDPEYSIRLAARHTKLLFSYFPLNSKNYERNVVMAYNQGQGNQFRFIEKENADTLLDSEYPAARNHWKKYLSAKNKVG